MPAPKQLPIPKRATWTVVAAAIGLAGATLGAGWPSFAAGLARPDGPVQIEPSPAPAALLRAACTDGNPYVAVAVMFPSEDGGFSDYNESVSALHDTLADDIVANYTQRILLALHGQVGSTYGLAYDWQRNDLYSSAYHAIQKPFGPGGVGAIYRTDLDTGQTEVWARLGAGRNQHGQIRRLYDYESAPWVGKVSLGDIEVNADASVLFAVNLHDRRIYGLSVPDGQVLTSFAHGASGEAWAEDARPFGLGYRAGWLYHGVVDSRESRRSGVPTGYVYRSREGGSEMSRVAEIAFDYAHRPPWTWWHNVLDPLGSAQPVIADVDFESDGDLLLGIRNRVVDMHEALVAGGDLLKAEWQPAGGRYVVADAGFYDDELPADASQRRRDAVIGGLASLPTRDEVAVTGLLFWPGQGGIPADAALWFSNRSGALAGPHQGVEWLISDFSGEGDIELLCGPVTATPTPTPGSQSTPTATPPPTASATAAPPTGTPTATATPVPTASPSPPAFRIYLPFAGRACVRERRPLDVVLVIDRSTSMLRPVAEGGLPKNAAAIDAAAAFAALLNLAPGAHGEPDRVAVVGFNEAAWTETPFTESRGAIAAALMQLETLTAEGTRLDLAFDQAGREVASARDRRQTTVAVILLTDGLPNRVPFPEGSSQEAVVLAAAGRVKDARAVIYTIGLGRHEDIAVELLRLAATAPSMYYEVPDPSDLAAIYAEIAVRIADCP